MSRLSTENMEVDILDASPYKQQRGIAGLENFEGENKLDSHADNLFLTHTKSFNSCWYFPWRCRSPALGPRPLTELSLGTLMTQHLMHTGKCLTLHD